MRLCETIKVGDMVEVFGSSGESKMQAVEALGGPVGYGVVGGALMPVYHHEVGDEPAAELLESHGVEIDAEGHRGLAIVVDGE